MANITMTQNTQATNTQWTSVRMLLHAEGVAVAIATIALYIAYSAQPWWWIPALFLIPDLAFLLYLVNKQLGVLTYNLVHHYGFPLLVGVLSLANGWDVGLSLALIWGFHIGIDRGLGYGFKYGLENKVTHITRA